MPKSNEGTSPLQAADWERIAGTQKFRLLLREKRRFVIPASIFFTGPETCRSRLSGRMRMSRNAMAAI